MFDESKLVKETKKTGDAVRELINLIKSSMPAKKKLTRAERKEKERKEEERNKRMAEMKKKREEAQKKKEKNEEIATKVMNKLIELAKKEGWTMHEFEMGAQKLSDGYIKEKVQDEAVKIPF